MTFRTVSIRAALLGASALAAVSAPAYAQQTGNPADQPTASGLSSNLNPTTPTGPTTTTPPANAPVAPAVAAGNPTPPPGTTDPNLAAQPTSTPDTVNPAANEIVVTGYRRSLQESVVAKHNATAFTDSIFAEDIGKFPDINIAESLNRIPGVTITRDITGEGTNIAIRGLGTQFTEVTLNGAPIAIASSGTTDAQGTGREVDLSFFPTDLFTKLTVNKSYTPDLLEGGAAGNVDIRSARPFDTPGSHFTYNFQGTHASEANGWGERGSAIISKTFGDTFGILAGVSGERRISRVTGFETIGWTNANLSAAQCGATSGCNTTGGGNWTIPATVPSNAGNGLTPGTPIDSAFLLAHNPGLTIQQIDNAILPRLGRPSDEYGDRNRVVGTVSLEWRPSDALHFYVDSMLGYKKNNLQRVDMDWVVRNGAIIPLNMTVDKANCANGCTVTGGTFANAQSFLEYRPYIETTHFWSVNPGGSWDISDKLKLNFGGNYTRSTFHRESPSVLVITPPNSGDTVTYANNGGIPSIVSSLDLNSPANFGWNGGGRVNIQDERRVNETKGLRADLTWGDERLNLKIGGNYDDILRRISAFDNSQAWQNAVCGDNPSVFVPSPNSQPPCQGLSVVGAAPAGYPTYPGYGTGYTAGMTGPVTYAGSLIPASSLGNYLVPGRDGYVTVNWPAFVQASNYNTYHANEPSVGSANTGASGGFIEEKSPAIYFELNGKADMGDNDLRYSVGARWVHTNQTIAGLVSLPDPRDTPPPPATAPADGGKYPNITSTVTTHSSYSNWLPALNLAYDIGEHATARLALSQTMTRPDPNAQLPGVNFSTPSADVASIGNPALKPYLSKNIDIGVELYPAAGVLVSLAAFHKELSGFTTNGISTVPFSALATYGITYDTLTPTQQAAINARGGPGSATVQVQQQVNASGKLSVNGLEFQWVQPLDFLTERFGVRGFGFNANATVVNQNGSGAAPAVAIGVAPYTYNITGYYEHGGVMLRLSTTFQKGSQQSSANQNGIPAAAIFSDDYQEYDFSSIFDLEKMFGWRHAPQITFDVVNLTKAKLRSYFQFENATFTEYNPGRQFLIGIRGTF